MPDDDLSIVISSNAPLPLRDLEARPAESLGAPAGAALSSFLTLDAALAHAGYPAGAPVADLFTAEAAASRYTVLITGGTPPVEAAVVAAVPRTAPVRDQVAAVLHAPAAAAIAGPGDLKENVVLLAFCGREMHLGASTRPGLNYHWIREVAAGRFEGQAGVPIDPGMQAAVEVGIGGGLAQAVAARDGALRMRLFQAASAHAGVGASISVSARFEPQAQPRAVTLEQVILSDLTLGLDPALKVSGMLTESVASLAASICQTTLTALETQLSADLACRYQRAGTDSALIDCTFDCTPEGLTAFRAALDGKLPPSGVTGAARLNQTVFSSALALESVVELHLPFLDRQQWTTRLEAIASVRVQATADGRVLAYTAEASDEARQLNSYQSVLALSGAFLAGTGTRPEFKLAYSWTQTLRPVQVPSAFAAVLSAYGFDPAVAEFLSAPGPQTWNTTLSLTVPGVLCEAWLHAPGTRSVDFFDVYQKVSVAVQRATRKWLPYLWFSDLDHYDDLGSAHSLLVYQATRPCSGRPRSDFTYDIQSPDGQELLRLGLARNLANVLKPVEQLLRAGGKRPIARFYTPDQAMYILTSVQRHPELLNALLVADTFFVDSLVRLGTSGRAFSDTAAADPGTAVRRLAAFAAGFVTTFHRRLKRLYGGRDFTAFGSLLLVEATRALNAALGQSDARISAVLRATGSGPERVWVNSDYQAA